MLQSACRIAVCGALGLCPYSIRSPCGVSPSAHRWGFRHSSGVSTRTSKRGFRPRRALLLATPQQQHDQHEEPTRLDPSSPVGGEGGMKENGELEDGTLGSRAGVASARSAAAGSCHEGGSQTTTTTTTTAVTTTAKNRAGRAVHEKVGISGSGSPDSVRSPPPSPSPPPTAPLEAPALPSPPLDVLHQDQNFA